MLFQVANPLRIVSFVIHVSILPARRVGNNLPMTRGRNKRAQHAAAPNGILRPLGRSRTASVRAVAARDSASIRMNAGL